MNDFDIIKSIVDRGISMMKNDLSEQEFNIWTDYTRKMLNITNTPAMQTIEIGFLQVLISLSSQYLTPYQKLNACIKYLLETMKRGNPNAIY